MGLEGGGLARPRTTGRCSSRYAPSLRPLTSLAHVLARANRTHALRFTEADAPTKVKATFLWLITTFYPTLFFVMKVTSNLATFAWWVRVKIFGGFQVVKAHPLVDNAVNPSRSVRAASALA